MTQQLSDDALRKKTIEVMHKRLAEVDGNFEKALFLACALNLNLHEEMQRFLDMADGFFLQVMLTQPKKKCRGRPRKVVIDESSGLTPKARIRKRIGAPKKYLPEIPNWVLGIRIANIAEKQQTSFTNAARIELERYGLQQERSFIKTLAEEAKKYAEGRRELKENLLFNSIF